jgi:hypothetical protein
LLRSIRGGKLGNFVVVHLIEEYVFVLFILMLDSFFFKTNFRKNRRSYDFFYIKVKNVFVILEIDA